MPSLRHIGSNLSIKPRRLKFAFNEIENRYWYDGNPLMTTLFAGLSATFPPGEMKFVESIRHYRDRITDQELQEQIRGFIGQEGHHGHQHRKINQKMTELGLPVTELEQRFTDYIESRHKYLSPAHKLAMTVAAEHLTAILAEHMLTHQDLTEPMHPVAAELILWHAVEEIEHKSVAFDVYMECVGSRKLLRRSMVMFTIDFILTSARYQMYMLNKNKTIPSPKQFWDYGKFLFGKKGLVSGTRKAYMEFYKDDFHPWDNDNMDLIEQWKQSSRSVEEAEYDAELLLEAV